MNPPLDTFLAEAAALLGEVDAGLLQLGREPDDPELVNQVFRAAHTITGSAGRFGFTELARVTHTAEDLLDAVRAGDRRLDPELAGGLLAAFDLVRRYLAAVTTTGELPADAAVTSAEVIARLGGPAPAAAVPIEAEPAVAGTAVKDPAAVADAWFLLAGALSGLAAGGGQGQLMSVARSARTAADLLGLDTTDLAAAQTAGAARDALRALLAQQMVAPTATYHPEPEPAVEPAAPPGSAPAAPVELF
jgi:chemotaxis protein histidine kinase CheA